MTPAERDEAFEELGKSAIEAVTEFLAGTATLQLTWLPPAAPHSAPGWAIRLVRDPKP